jgi:hypothetical protein
VSRATIKAGTDFQAPWTASWTGEERLFVAPCLYAGGHLAICQPRAQGLGKPLFKTPHSIRQRQAIANGLCDLCGVPLGTNRVSLSFERFTDVGCLQTEPLLHRRCAAISLLYCPHLKRHRAAGTLLVREVYRYDVAIARLTAAAVLEFTGESWPDGAVYGHAKLRILKAEPRDVEWIEEARAES